MTDLEMSKLIAKKVHNKGGKAYYVGGYVRDKILNKENKDIDIEVYNITPDNLRTILDSCGEHTEHGKSFGVFGLKGYDIDISIPRTERCIGTKHTDFDVTLNPFITVKEGAKRRDLTMNAIMYNIMAEAYIDPYNGINDIKNNIIRHVNSETFVEDPLRVLRVAQFASRFDNMKISDETIELCKTIDISTLSKERIFTELEKALLKSNKPSIFFNTLRKMNKLTDWFFEVDQLINLPQNEIHHKEGDVYNHTMLALDYMAQSLRNYSSNTVGIMLATLCHDFGKIVTTENINGITHSYNHEKHGVPITDVFLKRITNDTNIIKYVENLVELHMMPHQLFNDRSKMKKSNKMFDSCMCPTDLIALAYVDSRSSKKEYNIEVEFATNERYWLLDRLEIYKKVMSKPYVKGKDLVKCGLKPGPYFTELLEFSHKLRLAGVDKDNTLKQTIALSRKVIPKYEAKTS